MRQFSISVSITFLAFFILLGSGGFTIGKMICGGNECTSTYTLGRAKDCCASEKTPVNAEFKSCCCELIDVSYSLDEFSVSEKVNVSALEFNSFCSTTEFSFYLPSDLFHLPCPEPSPPDPRGYLYRICSLLL